MSTHDCPRAIVVGAGIAGLAAAFRLRQQGWQVTIIECEPHIGGRMSTLSRGDYRIDRCSVWLDDSYREMVRLIRDAGIADLVVPASDEFALVRDGTAHSVRSSRIGRDLLTTGLLGVRSKITAINLLRDCNRAARRLLRTSGSAPEELEGSAADYARRRLNSELLRYFLEPLCMSYFYAAPEEVTLASVLFAVNGIAGARPFNFPGGVDALPRALARHVDVRTCTRVTHIERNGANAAVRYRDDAGAEHCETVDGCVVAIPGSLLPELIPQLSADQRDLLSGLRYRPDVHVSFGLDHRPPGTLLLAMVPEAEQSDIRYYANFHLLPGRAPAGKGLLRLALRTSWSQRHWDKPDDEVAAAAAVALRGLMPALADHVDAHQDMYYVHRQKHALLHRAPGDHRRLADFTATLDPGSPIQLAGDFLAWSNTNSALATGECAAANLIGHRTTGYSRPRAESSGGPFRSTATASQQT